MKIPREVACLRGVPFSDLPVGAETLNPHECRGKLRKSQEMRRALGCAVLCIKNYFRKFRIKRNMSNRILFRAKYGIVLIDRRQA